MNIEKEDDGFRKALSRCGITESNERQRLERKTRDFARSVTQFRRRFNRLLQTVRWEADAAELDRDFIQSLRTFSQELRAPARTEVERLRAFIRRRKGAESRHAVTLFGRTNAGKSTLREAITGGDGSTIGEGEQRTTTEVSAYEWEGMTLLDTPGIASYEEEDDAEIAWEAVDRSDVVLFLVMSDSIQKSEFDELVEIRQKNKPVTIVLNVKYDVSPRRRRKFLRRKTSEVTPEGQQKNIAELRHRARRYLGHPHISVIPIHARAAFEAHHADDPEESEALQTASRLDALTKKLRKQAADYGRSYRVRSYRDAFVHSLERTRTGVEAARAELQKSVAYHEKKQSDLESWFGAYQEKTHERIQKKVHSLFQSHLYTDIDSFVERHAGQDDAEKKWADKIENMNLHREINEIVGSIAEEAQDRIREHLRQIEFDESVLDFSVDTDLKNVKKGFLGRILKTAAALADIVSVFTGGLSRLIGSAIRGVKSFFGIDDHEDYDKKKAKVKSKLREATEAKEKEVQSELEGWFDQQIAAPFRSAVKVQGRQTLRAQKAALRHADDWSAKLEQWVERENSDLIRRLLSFQEESLMNLNIVRVVRYQGAATKILVTDDTCAEGNVNQISCALGEAFDIVSHEASTENQVTQALASLGPQEVSHENGFCRVALPLETLEMNRQQIDHHVELCQQLLNTSIELVSSDKNVNH